MSVELLDPPVAKSKPKVVVAPSMPVDAPVIEMPPEPFTWTPESYHRAADLGLFEGRRVELIRGRILEMSPVGPDHVVGRIGVEYRLRDHFTEGGGWVVIGQIPMRLKDSEPEPDVVVYRGSVHAEPAKVDDVVLVVEVSKSSLTFDRREKLSLYAETGYRDYWILNLRQRVLEVYRDPQRQADGSWEYANRTTIQPDGVAHPLAMPDASLKVADLLPPADADAK